MRSLQSQVSTTTISSPPAFSGSTLWSILNITGHFPSHLILPFRKCPMNELYKNAVEQAKGNNPAGSRYSKGFASVPTSRLPSWPHVLTSSHNGLQAEIQPVLPSWPLGIISITATESKLGQIFYSYSRKAISEETGWKEHLRAGSLVMPADPKGNLTPCTNAPFSVCSQ